VKKPPVDHIKAVHPHKDNQEEPCRGPGGAPKFPQKPGFKEYYRHAAHEEQKNQDNYIKQYKN
jgi:hypothetical protein